MARKGLIIVVLIGILGAFFYFRIYFNNREQEPSIIDRLPTADFIGKADVLEIAREISPFLFYNKIPFRDFMSYEFLLAQGKNYGIDLQSPAYFFANENGEWGALVSVNDSSKIVGGLQRLRRDVVLQDTLVGDQRVIKVPAEKVYMTYGKNWLFLYHGLQLTKRLNHVRYSRRGEQHAIWTTFLKSKPFAKESLAIYSNWKKTKNFGLETLIFSQDCDSINMRLKVYAKSKTPLKVKLKEQGIGISSNTVNTKALNLHLDISAMRKDRNHPLIKWLTYKTKRINFPVAAFFEAWEGDLIFYEGGFQKVKEQYIEIVMDEEFNTSEVKREKEALVPGYTVLFSMNENQKKFISKLFAKGIMTKENNRFRLLASPPLRINQKPNFLMLYSADYSPKIVQSVANEGYWVENRTRYNFKLDSLGYKDVFFSIDFPALRALRHNKFF